MYVTARGRYVGTQDEARADGKGWHLELVPDQKADLIAYLNDKLAAPVEAPAPAPVEAPAPVMAPASDYHSPLSASTVIAGIDAGMCSAAIRQMTGKNLGKVLAACVERLAVLQAGVEA